MKKVLMFLFLIQFVTIYGCAIKDIQEGDRVTKTYEISDFTKLDVSHAFEVTVRVGDETSLKITAGENIHPDIEVKNKENTLILSIDSFINNVGNIKAEITVKELEGLDASGACKIYIEGINTDSFELDMSGACKGELIGETKKLEVDISGASSLDAKDLRAEKVEVDISGASNAQVYASSSLEAEASGASSITFYGDPEKVETDVSGASNIKSK
ncbi:MAG: head GIN domain-containing protein [Bacteroidota bacterium]